MEKFLLYIAGFAGLLVLISLSFALLHSLQLKKENYIQGSKSFVVSQIVQRIYECKQAGEKKRYSFVCTKLKFECNESIEKDDILSSLDERKIDKNSVIVEDLGERGEIVISHENNKIYVKRIW